MNNLVKNIKKWHENREYAMLTIFAFAVLIVLELTVFNFRFYTNINNTPITSDFKLNGSINEAGLNTYQLGTGDKSIELTDIDTHIKNIYIDAEIKGDMTDKNNKKIKVRLSATDAGNSMYFDLPDRVIVYGLDNTKYIPINLNGDSPKMKINFIDCNNKTLVINNIIINNKIPFRFNAVRVILLYLILALIYIIRPKSHFYNYKFNTNSLKQNIVVTVLVVVNVAVILALGFAHPDKGINTASHHHQYHKLAEAMMDGHFYLNDEPAKGLISMDNPYDRHLRDKVMAETDGKYKWDTAYYDGKYYVYFGVVPEILFFLPTRLLGIMIINKAPVMIMTMLATIFGYLLIRELTRRWFKDTSFLSYLMLSVLFVSVSGIYLAIRIPDLYMIPISHALAFSFMGLYCWLKALPEDGEVKLKGVFLLLGSICMALVAGCRPQVVLASFLAIPLFWKAVFKDRELFSPKTIGKTAAFVVPYVVVAAFLMYYNYARFGNVFDFGQNYNLTVMDMVSEKFNIGKIPLSIFTYYFQPPVINSTFPFLGCVNISRNFMGNYVYETQFGGLIPCHIILLSLLFIPKVKSILKERKLFIPTVLMLFLGVLISIVDSNTGGIILRYMIDFMWLLFIPTVLVCFGLIEKYNDTPYKKIVTTFLFIAFIWSMVYTFMLLFNINAASYKDNIPQLHYYIQYLIEFWT
ncbi:MAG: hypothetical protein ACI4VF_07510 [Lachnospirales bacterium]